MTQRFLLPLGLVLALAAGCTDTTRGPIDFQVGGGFAGAGDGTPALRIKPDGTMTRTSAGDTQTTRLDRMTLDDLQAKVEAAQFATLDPTYTSSCLDCYVYMVAVQLDGTTCTVAVDEMAHPPAALEAAIATLKDISRR